MLGTFTLLIFIACSLQGVISCPDNCNCFNTTVDCSNVGLRTWPDGIDSTTEVVLLGDNLISKLDENVLVEYESLKFLILDSNKLTRLSLKIPASLEQLSISMNFMFSLTMTPLKTNGTINLIYLKLDLNMMRIVPKLPKSLRVVSIVGNQLKSLPEDTFNGLYSLEEIYLQYNQIAEFENNTFANLTKLHTLDIRNNMHTEIMYHWFNHKPLLSRVLLATVYLHCDCELVRSHYALEKLPIEEEDLENLKCYTPENLKGKLVEDMLNVKNFTNCVPEVNTMRQRRKIGVAVGIIFCVLLALFLIGGLTLWCFRKKHDKSLEKLMK